ncbi:hypothetical protein, partial [Candidatus Phytoplasma gossypii]
MMKTQNKNKILTILVIFLCTFLTISALSAFTNYFFRSRKEKIKLLRESDSPCFEVNRIDGNNEDKILLPLTIPNLNSDKYHHLITINHQAILNKKGMDINVPLYLKMTTQYDTENTFSHPETYFNLAIKNNGKNYDDTKRPLMIFNNEGIGKTDIQIQLEQREIIKAKNPQLTLT